MTRAADDELPEAHDVEMGAEDLGEGLVKRAKTIMGLEICMLEARDDVGNANELC